MLCVWTSQPSKVPAYCMSAPVVVNQYPLWVIFRRQAARCTMVVCKGEGRDSFCGGAWSIGWICIGLGYRSAVFICRAPHSCLLSAIDMARPRGCAPDSLPSFYGYNGRQVAPGD